MVRSQFSPGGKVVDLLLSCEVIKDGNGTLRECVGGALSRLDCFVQKLVLVEDHELGVVTVDLHLL